MKVQYERRYSLIDGKWVETTRRAVKCDEAEGTYTPTGPWLVKKKGKRGYRWSEK